MAENGNGHTKSYKFGGITVETELQTLLRGDTEIRLAKRPFDVLVFLIENRERIVGRDELLDRFWNGHSVYDDALRKCVGSIRRSLDDTNGTPLYIETRRGSGYRFIAEVEIEKPLSTTDSLAEIEIAHPGSANGYVEMHGSVRPARNFVAGNLNKNRLLIAGVSAICMITFATLAVLVFGFPRDMSTARSVNETIPEKHSIAILPLRNLTGDPAKDYLSDGITEGLINDISHIDSLKVISRGSAFQFKDKEVSAQEIGSRLGVEAILEGSLKQSGDEVRVEVRLVNAADGSVIWASNSPQTKLADIFAIEDGITCQIVTELKVKLCGDVPPAARYTQNVEAYQLYLKGLYFRNRLGAEDLKKAVDFFDQALKVDPNYALAHEGLALTYAVMELNAIVPPGTVASLAEQHATKALELDDTLAGAYLALGVVKTMNTYDLAQRERYYRQALLKNPNNRTAHLWLANNFTVQGKFEEAEREILLAQEIDPLSLGVHLTLAELYWYWNKPDKVIDQANIMLVANPDSDDAHGLLARAYAQKSDFEKALAELDKIPSDKLIHALILANAGRVGEARKYVDAFANSEDAKNSPFKTGDLYAAVGDKEKAFAWLEKSYAMRQADLVSIKIDPALDSLRGDPRYADLMRRVNLDSR